MGRIPSIATALCILLAGLSYAQEPESIGLLVEGTFPGSGQRAESGQDWFAVRKSPGGVVLEKTRVEVTDTTNTCTGTAIQIQALDVSEPLFMVSGSPLFQPGPVDSVFDEPRFIYPAEGFSVQLESGKWFGFQAYGSATPAESEVHVSDYEIHIRQGSRSQTLADLPRIDWDGRPRLIWAGDLDRDGNLDALLDLTAHYAGNLYVLFLSSAAGDDHLVKRVAEFSVDGC